MSDKSDYDKEVGKWLGEARDRVKEHIKDDSVREGFVSDMDKAQDGRMNPPQSPVGKPFPIISGRNKFYDSDDTTGP